MPSRSLSDDRVTVPLRAFGESLNSARTLILIAAPMGMLVGAAIAGYDWVVNELLWSHVLQQPIAIQIASKLLGAGHSVDIGIKQIKKMLAGPKGPYYDMTDPANWQSGYQKLAREAGLI